MKIKYTLQTARKPSWKNAILLTIIALALSASPTVALAADCLYQTNWTGGISDWFTSSNWSNGVPNCLTSASIDQGGTAQITHADATANACSVTLGTNSGDSGKLSVNDGNANSCTNDTLVGLRGTGSLSISNGGTLTSDLTAQIASEAGSNGSATVDGTNSTWTVDGELDVGGTNSIAGGTGLLSATNGGTASAATLIHVYKSGTLTGNSTVNVNSGSGTATVEGTLSPNWTLTINGDLTFSSTASTSPTMQCNVTPDNLNSVDAEVTKTATLTGRVSVTMTGTFTPGTTYTLLNADVGVSGTFTMESINFPPGQNFTPKIEYDTHHVKLYLQPNT